MSFEISPFTVIIFKEDDESIVVGTNDTSLGYMVLLEIDGVSVDDIVACAQSHLGEDTWQEGLARNFPRFVSELATKGGKTCFVDTKKAVVDYADINTGEVLEATLDATAENFNECVRIESSRAEHTVKINKAGADEDDDDDDYEDMDEYEDEDGAGEVPKAYLQRRQFFDMFSTQLETVLSIGMDIGLTIEEMTAAYKEVVGDAYPVPETPEECIEMAQHDLALHEYLNKLGGGGGGGAGGGNCPQQ